MLSRLLRAILAGLQEVLRSFWRVTRQLFHEATGAFFVLFAALGGIAAWRDWKQGLPEWRIAVAVVFAVAMAGFAVASFRSARRVR